MIFCLPALCQYSDNDDWHCLWGLTVSARLDGSLNVPDALHRDAILVVAVDVLVLQLSNFVEKDAQLVGDVRDVLVTALSPDGQLLL